MTLCKFYRRFAMSSIDLDIFSQSPADVQDALFDPASGRRYASTKYIDDAGHLVSVVGIRNINLLREQ